MDIFEKALIFATKAHSGVTRKFSNKPYILHPVEVATIVSSMTTDREPLAAAVLHDVVEDTEIPIETIRDEFGDRVAELVAMETEDKRKDLPAEETWMLRKEESLRDLKETSDPAVKMIWLGDKLSNVRSFCEMKKQYGTAMWESFHQKDPEMQRWYYTRVAELTSDLCKYPAWTEYHDKLNYIFDGENHNDQT